MSVLLYLDTARLGRMTPGAQQTYHDFVRLAGAEGGSAYFERFLRTGVEGLPPTLRDRFPGLLGWQGIPSLKRSLRQLTGEGSSDLPVLLANRSAQLMKLAARLLFHPCRNVLTTDLDWPGYRDLLAGEAHRANRVLTVAPVRQATTTEGVSEDELVERVCGEFARSGCDGLFLTAVSSDGLRLPIVRLVQALQAVRHVRFVVVDGSQDFCHAGVELRVCDLYLTGGHKWLGAYHPLGIGFYGRTLSRSMIETLLTQMIAIGDLDDPLLRYSCRPQSTPQDGFGETVNLTPLFSCQGAVDDGFSEAAGSSESLTTRLSNGEAASKLAALSGWHPLSPAPSLRSGILMLRPENPAVGRQRPEVVKEAFRDRGISLSTYPEGRLRLSMPSAHWTDQELTQLSDGLRAVNKLFG